MEWEEVDQHQSNIKSSVLKEGSGTPPVPTSEPITIEQASKGESTVSVVARVISVKPDQIVKRDGSGTIDVVRGRVGDQTGSIGFLSWKALEVKEETWLRSRTHR